MLSSHPEKFMATFENAWMMTDPDGTDEQTERIASIVATAAINAAVMFSATDDARLTWITKQDELVRAALVSKADGQQLCAGTGSGVYRSDDRGDPVVQISPPLVAGQQQFDEIVSILANVLEEAWTRVSP